MRHAQKNRNLFSIKMPDHLNPYFLKRLIKLHVFCLILMPGAI